MPTNPEHIYAALHEMGPRLQDQVAADARAQELAMQMLRTLGSDPQRLKAAADSVTALSDPHLRCALPGLDAIDKGRTCRPSTTPITMVATDGSQVVPDRHEELLFGLINVGVVTMRPASAAAPEIAIDTTILIGSDLYPDAGPLLSEGDIALRRDARERATLLRHAPTTLEPFISLLDGPLELWGAKDVAESAAFEHALADYLADLRELERRRAILAGYVDKPGADLVVRFLEVSQAGAQDLRHLRNFHPLHGASDRWLFSRILEPEQRSAVFGLISGSRSRYTGSLALNFFYLNVGSDGHPSIARIEVPQWVADHADRMDALHHALIAQCRILGTRPYPYILHRAHETALVSIAEKEQIKLRLLLELRNRGLEPDLVSAKSSAKAVSQIKGSMSHG
jgi:NurA domain-containing protein